MKNKGFTLIELLATLIILALITSVVTIVTLNTMKKAKEKERTINLRGQYKKIQDRNKRSRKRNLPMKNF